MLRNTSILGVPNTKRVKRLSSGYFTPDFSGAQKRAELLCNTYIPGGPQRQARQENQ